MIAPIRVGALVAAAFATIACMPRAGATKWPTAKRYKQAMQNYDHYIRDPKLLGSRLERDAKNEPLRWGGKTFGSVFKIVTRSGRKIAFKVFHPLPEASERQDAGQLEGRYHDLSEYLGGLRAEGRLPPEIIEFAMVPRALLIDGQWLPVLKTPWLDGSTLDEWVGDRIAKGRTDAVMLQAENWRALMRDLDSLDIALGDLRHNNILVEPDGMMRLYDYDSMYVPALQGLPNSEIGDPNFQHPAYHFPAPSERPFDRNMDHFSAIVIYLSLIATAHDPSLWQRYHDENNLLFQGERDFLHLDTSPLFQELKTSSNPQVRSLARKLTHYASGPPEDVPPLETAIAEAEALSVPSYQRNTDQTRSNP